MGDMDADMRKMLIKLSNKIKGDELKSLIFYAKIKGKNRDGIEQAIDLFRILEERRDIKPDDVGYLREMIAHTLDTREDLLLIIDEYITRRCDSNDGAGQNSVDGAQAVALISYNPVLQEEKLFLSKNVGKGWKFFLRRLGIQDNFIEEIEYKNRNNQRETINECVQKWLDEEKDRSSEELYEMIVVALKKEDRNDLVRKLRNRQFD